LSFRHHRLFVLSSVSAVAKVGDAIIPDADGVVIFEFGEKSGTGESGAARARLAMS